MAERPYEGRRIVARSFRSGLAWRTEVVVWSPDGRGGVTETMLDPPPSDWFAATEEEADQYGLAIGRAWIDRHA